MTSDVILGIDTALLDRLAGIAPLPVAKPAFTDEKWVPAPRRPKVALSAEQQKVVDAVCAGQNVVVDACIGSGKTSTIQELCAQLGGERQVLYLTYSKLLKRDAQNRVGQAKVQNFHGIVYPWLLRLGIKCGLGESVAQFNKNFEAVTEAGFPRYDVMVVDEYQDLTEEYAQLLLNIKSLNPRMQVVLVGDMEQKVRSDTVLDVRRFVGELCGEALLVPFTQSFRMGVEMGELLGDAWNKPIVGVNAGQQVEEMGMGPAKTLIASLDPSQVLCLGSRNGLMSEMLNVLETQYPEKYNKNTVYASIRDGDANAEYGDSTAVFTTFDSSKGLERPVAVVFDFDESFWDLRLRMPNVDPVILRNVFLVAASRGKERVVFVRGQDAGDSIRSKIGFIPTERFLRLPAVEAPEYGRELEPAQCFDFKYAENVEECFGLLSRRRLDDGTGTVIDIDRTDGLIDLSPAVGHYQEALYFSGYDASKEITAHAGKSSTADRVGPIAKRLLRRNELDAWKGALLLSAIDTEQMRYAEQVDRVVDATAEAALKARLATLLPPNAPVQVHTRLQGVAYRSDGLGTQMDFGGFMDVVYEGAAYELKFTTELSHTMFLQLGMYLVLSKTPRGVLWNTRTDERWEVKVPDAAAFMDAAAKCVSKQWYDGYAMGADAETWEGNVDGDDEGEDEPVW